MSTDSAEGSTLWCKTQVRTEMIADSSKVVADIFVVGKKESWKGGQLISVASTERGLLMSLPRLFSTHVLQQQETKAWWSQ
jgi:hypothetical protein